jgi:hypothetical protein
MAKKRKNELDELLRDAVKFMEWPTGGGPTSARIELPEDFSEEEKTSEESSSTAEQRKKQDSKEQHQQQTRNNIKRPKREEFYVPEKPLSPDSDVEEGIWMVNNKKTRNLVGPSSAAVGISYNKETPASKASRLNLLSLVQETSFANKEGAPSTTASGASSPRSFSVPVPGGRGSFLAAEAEVGVLPSDNKHHMSVTTSFTAPPVVEQIKARHPLLSFTGQRAEHQGTPFIRGFLMGLPSRR